MPLVPERKSSRNDVKSAINGQFWESPCHSTRYLDGVVWSLPCEPPALSLMGSSGLSRTQQLIAAQAVGVPALPSFNQHSDGLVFDRVLAKFGGRKWWTALTGRAKVQRIYKQATIGTSKLEALRDLDNYALCARGRFQLGHRITVNGTAEMSDVRILHSYISGDHHRQQGPISAGNGPTMSGSGGIPVVSTPSAPGHCGLHGSVRCALPGHDLVASVGKDMDYADSSGDYAHIPLAMSLDLSSLDRGDGLQYRVGLHQVTAPPTELEVRGGSRRQRHGAAALRSVLHAQGAVAVEGEAFVWRGGKSVTSSNSLAQTESPSSSTTSSGRGKESTENASQPSAASNEPTTAGDKEAAKTTKIASAIEKAKTADHVGSDDTDDNDDHLHSDDDNAAATDEGTDKNVAAVGDNEQQQQGKSALQPIQESLEGFLKPLGDLTQSIQQGIHLPMTSSSDSATTEKHDTSLAEKEGDSTTHNELAPPARVIPVTAESLSAAIQESLAALTQLRDSAIRLTGEVQDGSLQRLSEQLSRKPGPRSRPYSMLLGHPYVKLNAAMGCLARMPLPNLLKQNGEGGLMGSSSGNGSGVFVDASEVGFGRRNASTSSLASRASMSSQLAEAWEPYLKGTALRVFASASISGQIGRFSRRFLDYTAGVVRVDVGLSSPHVVGDAPGTMDITHHCPDKHRAFALEGRGSWHALSASVTQQLYGPIRARADFRFALDPTNIPQDQGERSTLKGLAQTALSVRPSLLEAVYGFDCVLPGTEGAGRVALWWSPKRGEAMAELRLF